MPWSCGDEQAMKTCTSCGGLRVEPGDGYPGQMVSGRPCSCLNLSPPSQLDRIEAKLNRIENNLDRLVREKDNA